MNKLFHLITICLSIALFTACQSTKNTTSKQNRTLNLAKQKTLLWKISGQDLKQPSYIFGTIHLIPEQYYFFPDTFKQALEQCEAVFFEIDMNSNPMMSSLMGDGQGVENLDLSNLGAIMQLLSKFNMKDSKTLQQLYTPQEYKVVKDYLTSKLEAIAPGVGSIGFQLIQRWKPLFLSTFLSSLDTPTNQGETMVSYEVKLNTIATEQDLPVKGLEGINYQIGLFDRIPYEKQAALLYEEIQQSETPPSTDIDNTALLYELYQAQDIHQMYVATTQSFGSIEEFVPILLDERNENWVSIIEKQSIDTPIFYAVGAGHLAGEKGVLQLLYNKGYQVEPIYSN